MAVAELVHKATPQFRFIRVKEIVMAIKKRRNKRSSSGDAKRPTSKSRKKATRKIPRKSAKKRKTAKAFKKIRRKAAARDLGKLPATELKEEVAIVLLGEPSANEVLELQDEADEPPAPDGGPGI
jgi:hypothetical protein